MKEEDFLDQINQNKGIIFKLINLYVDDEEEKQDVFQEILMQTWHARNRFRGTSKFSTWLYKICLHTLLTFSRKQKRANGSVEELDHHPTNEEEYSVKERSEMLYVAIKQLSEIEKAVITMHLEGFTNQEIADFMGVSSNNVNVKIHRIKEKLAKLLKSKDYGIA